MAGVLTAFIIFVLFPGVILGFILLSRYLKYRETLTLLQHGITPPAPMLPPPPMARPPVVAPQGSGGGRGTLIWGLVLAAIGLALTLALWPIGFIANSASGNSVNFPLGLGPWMLAGFVPLFIGLALTLGYIITRPERPNPPPAQWAPGFPTGEGGAGRSYPAPWAPTPGFPQERGATGAHPTQWMPGTPPIHTPLVPTEAVVQEEAPEPTPPSIPAP